MTYAYVYSMCILWCFFFAYVSLIFLSFPYKLLHELNSELGRGGAGVVKR